jgi:hypothetical protein
VNKIEIKKALYKQKPKATLTMIRKGVAYYKATVINNGSNSISIVKFEIPTSDMGDADYFIDMDAKHLGRWIVMEE